MRGAEVHIRCWKLYPPALPYSTLLYSRQPCEGGEVKKHLRRRNLIYIWSAGGAAEAAGLDTCTYHLKMLVGGFYFLSVGCPDPVVFNLIILYIDHD